METKLYKQIQEQFLFLFKMEDLSAVHGGGVGLLETGVIVGGGELSLSSFSLSRMGFLLNLPSPNRQTLLVKKQNQ